MSESDCVEAVDVIRRARNRATAADIHGVDNVTPLVEEWIDASRRRRAGIEVKPERWSGYARRGERSVRVLRAYLFHGDIRKACRDVDAFLETDEGRAAVVAAIGSAS